jgi:Kef-type K+ transport system membrane component KefB
MEEGAAGNLIFVSLAIALAAAVPALLPRLPIPGAVLEIALGVIIGPQVLGLARPDVILDFLSDFGVGILFLMAGFEMSLTELRGRPLRNAALGWVISAAIAGYTAFILVRAELAQAPVLTALALTTTSIGLLLPVLRDENLLRAPYGPMVLAVGALGEGAPLFILPLVFAHQGGAEAQALIMVGFAIGAALSIMAASIVSRGAFADLVERTMGTSGQLPMRLALLVLICLILVADRFGIDFILGAFVAGAVVRAALAEREHEAMAVRLDGIGSAFLIPVFFLTSGMNLDIAALIANPSAMVMVFVYALLMLAVRGAPAFLLYADELGRRQTVALALHSGTQLSLVVAITACATSRGLMPSHEAAALIGAAMVTVMFYPALASHFLNKPAA